MSMPLLGGGMPIPVFAGPQQIRDERNSRVPLIFKNWRELHGIVQRHESVLRNRWIKWSKKKRSDVLLKAWPSIPKNHRPDIAAWMQRESQKEYGPSRNRTPFLWPQLNVADLSKTEPLLLMLNSRGRHTPDVFSWADYESCHLGVVSLAIDRLFLNEHVMLLRGQKTEEEYGKLLHWDDHEDAFTWFDEQRQHPPGEGVLILEIQDHVYNFLVKCCKIILHDISPLVGSDIPVKPEPPALSAGNEAVISMAKKAFESGYRLPASIDLAEMELFCRTRVNEAMDHLWMMRQDPGYYSAEVHERREHSRELIHSGHSGAGQRAPGADEDDVWCPVVCESVADALEKVGRWTILLNRVRTLRSMMSLYGSQIDPDQDLPQPIALEFYKLQATTEDFIQRVITDVAISFKASPPMRSNYKGFGHGNAALRFRTSKAQQTPAEAELISLVMTLEDKTSLYVVGKRTLLDRFSQLMETDDKAKACISSQVANNISLFADLADILYQISLFQPWAATFDGHSVSHKTEIKKCISQQNNVLSATRVWKLERHILQLGVPKGNAFNYPAHRKLTKENSQTMRGAEARLDKFWDAVIQHTKLTEAQNGALSRLLYRTPEWTEVKTVTPSPSSTITTDIAFRPFPGAVEPKQRLPDKKEKVKTRGEATAILGQDEQPRTAASETIARATSIAVDARSIKVFQVVFFYPGQSGGAARKDLPWVEFLHAMTNAGFSALKRYGSEWSFKPSAGMPLTDADQGREGDEEESAMPIGIHEPHPGSRVPFYTARAIGRRLTRHYGWTVDTFTLRV